MKYVLISPFLLQLSCARENVSYSADFDRELQICHNPESTNHRKICSEKCFDPNLGSHSFCWTLLEQDCQEPLTYEWQRENCHLFD